MPWVALIALLNPYFAHADDESGNTRVPSPSLSSKLDNTNHWRMRFGGHPENPAIGGSRESQGCMPPGSTFFHFHAVFGEKWPKLVWGILDPPLAASNIQLRYS